MGIEFQKYPSISRYRKNISITEKVDGTNAAIGIIRGIDWPMSGNGVAESIPPRTLLTSEKSSESIRRGNEARSTRE